MRICQRFEIQPRRSLEDQCRTERCERVSYVLVGSCKDSYPVLCIRLTSSSILRLPALWSGSDKPTPRSGAGMAGIGRVGAGTRLEDVGEESVEANELTEEVDIGLIKRSRLRMGEAA